MVVVKEIVCFFKEPPKAPAPAAPASDPDSKSPSASGITRKSKRPTVSELPPAKPPKFIGLVTNLISHERWETAVTFGAFEAMFEPKFPKDLWSEYLLGISEDSYGFLEKLQLYLNQLCDKHQKLKFPDPILKFLQSGEDGKSAAEDSPRFPYLWEFDSEEKELFEEFKTKVFERVPDIVRLPERFDDIELSKFLRANNFEVGKAVSTVQGFWDFCKEHKVAEEPPDHLKELDSLYAQGWIGSSNIGHPVYVSCLGFAQFDKIMSKFKGEELIAHRCCAMEKGVRLVREFAKKKGDQRYIYASTIQIMDLKGFDVSKQGLSLFNFLRLSIALASRFHPDTVYKLFIINCFSTFKTVYDMMFPLIPIYTRKKLSVLDDSFKGPLLEIADKSSLPTFLGGDVLWDQMPKWYDYTYMTVGPRLSETLKFPVKAKECLVWKCKLYHFDLQVVCELELPSTSAETKETIPAVELIEKKTVVAGKEEEAVGIVAIEKDGVLKITFDNSASMMRSKTFLFKLERPCETKECM